MSESSPTPLEHQHTPEAIQARIAATTEHSYLGDFVLGAIDGTVTTFAVVSTAAGAEMSTTVAMIMGVANLLADGLSMAAGNYLGAKANRDVVEKVRRIEERHIAEVPEGEREEIREIFAVKGFDGELLEQIVEVITQDHKRWVDTMVTEEFGLPLDSPSPVRTGLVTYLAFVLAGAIPLVPLALVAGPMNGAPFTTSCVLTAVTFWAIGMVKGQVVGKSLIRAGLETFTLGATTAIIAYFVGDWLQWLVA